MFIFRLRAKFIGIDILEVFNDGVKSTIEFNDFPAGAAVAFQSVAMLFLLTQDLTSA